MADLNPLSQAPSLENGDLSSKEHLEIFKMEHDRLNELFHSSEEFGEKRTTLMITITGFLFGGFFALLKDNAYFFFENDFLLVLLILALKFLILLGWITLIRMAHRNNNTDDYKEGLRLIKEYYLTKYEGLDQYLFFHSKHKVKPRKDAGFRGGYIEVIKLINSVLLALFFYMLFSFIFFKADNYLSFNHILIALLGSLIAGIIYWFIQVKIANWIFDKREKKQV